MPDARKTKVVVKLQQSQTTLQGKTAAFSTFMERIQDLSPFSFYYGADFGKLAIFKMHTQI